jgi:hypothetical protein
MFKLGLQQGFETGEMINSLPELDYDRRSASYSKRAWLWCKRMS